MQHIRGAYTDAQLALAESIMSDIRLLIEDDAVLLTAATHRVLRLIDAGADDPSDIVARVYRWLLWSGALRRVRIAQDGRNACPVYPTTQDRFRRPGAS